MSRGTFLFSQESGPKAAQEEAERKAKEEAERKAKEEAERTAKEEAERKAKEEAERQGKFWSSQPLDVPYMFFNETFGQVLSELLNGFPTVL